MEVLAQGKTKRILSDPTNPLGVIVQNLSVVTWDDKNSESMTGKNIWATRTTCNVFRVLVDAGLPVAFEGQCTPDSFRAPSCAMIPVEVIVRFSNEPNSSYGKRNPLAPVGPFDEPKVEFFLKTKGRTWGDIELPTDDPYIHRFNSKGMWVHHPKQVIDEGNLIFIPFDRRFGTDPVDTFAAMSMTAVTSGLVLQAAWARLGWTLGDFKEEFGFAPWGEILLADVLDNDSWRIKDPDGIERSKQNIRDGKAVADAAVDYVMVADVSDLLRHE